MMISRFNRRERGQNLVEFAFCLPFLLIILSIILDLGRYVSAKQTAINITREAGMLACHSLDSVTSTNFPLTMSTVVQNAQPVNMTNDGRIYIGKVQTTNNTTGVIQQYQAFGNLLTSTSAKVLTGGLNGTPTWPANVTRTTNQTIYIVEVYLRFVPVMPMSLYFLGGTFSTTNLGTTVYDASYF